MVSTAEHLPETVHDGPTRRRRRHWWRWTLAVLALVVVLVVVTMRSFISTPAPAPLALPSGAAGAAELGSLDGDWDVTTGSVAGFRVRESAFGASNDTVGRTDAVTGSVVVGDDHVTAVTFAVDLTAITVGEKPQPQFATSLGTAAEPTATFTLTAPIDVSPALTSGSTASGSVSGQLTMHGSSHPVTFEVSERRDGSQLLIVGSTPVAFADWGIVGPQGYGALGSLADHGVAEVLLVLERH